MALKVSEIRSMGSEEAKEKVVELHAELAKEKSHVASGTRPENPGNIRLLRRTIARILTIIAEKEKQKEAAKTGPAQKAGKEKSRGKKE